jgi:exodeoxyribonuclease VII small subunit
MSEKELKAGRSGPAPATDRERVRREATDLSFEDCLERLEKIVQELERGDQPLERALALFEEGMNLSASCRRKLEEAENRVEILLKKDDGKMVAEPFHLGNNDEQPS